MTGPLMKPATSVSLNRPKLASAPHSNLSVGLRAM